MKRLCFLIIIVSLCVCSCGRSVSSVNLRNEGISLNEQTLDQLGVAGETVDFMPINFAVQKGMWFTYMDCMDILKGKTEDEFTDSIKEDFEKMRGLGVNTVYVHVRAFGGSCYKSELFPPEEYFDGDYDPLEIMVREGHKLGLSIHGWVNPLRCRSVEQMNKIDGRYPLRRWYDSRRGTYIVEVDGRLYLNPAYSEVRKLIAEGVGEIVRNYDVDGIHIDDYFYPTSEGSFDLAAFKASGSGDLDKWRCGNINSMVKEMYSAVKREDKDVLFGISPQGNMSADYGLYADVKKWVSSEGFCDYIVPQVYFGFENESCPFEETVGRWQSVCTNKRISLVIGLCTYKIGREDRWAGSGKDEWIENGDIVSRQTAYCMDRGLGAAYYSFGSTFGESVGSERKRIAEELGGEGE